MKFVVTIQDPSSKILKIEEKDFDKRLNSQGFWFHPSNIKSPSETIRVTIWYIDWSILKDADLSENRVTHTNIPAHESGIYLVLTKIIMPVLQSMVRNRKIAGLL